MLVYRIAHINNSKNLKASGTKGRWNSVGKKVIYAAESVALALLENIVRRQGSGFNNDFKIMVIEIPVKAVISEIDISALKNRWRDFHDYSKCQLLGDKWYNAGKSLVLKVPSAVLPQSFNYVINTEHSQFALVKLIATTEFIPDERIEDILKKYHSK